ncbi:M23 family metallopeptidase [Herbaspirillum lusitanum]|uniref:M23 family metallopeptidase n=1 Tax=Herbaspirillum lusitanum TaxID=213312 RepID=A0ABW9AI16_9BURK
MLISPPFILTADMQTHYGNDEAILEASMPPTASNSTGTFAPEGSFPISSSLVWHNGVHLEAPRANGGRLNVRAIADGTIIFVQPPTKPNGDARHGQNYNPFGTGPAWSDNGCIIIEHETEIGADTASPTVVRYYSVYMHLALLMNNFRAGQKIYRKDQLGHAGQVYGRQAQLHFEICCDDANLKKLTGRTSAWRDPHEAPTADGRTDAVFGSVYYYLPATTPIRAQDGMPAQHLQLDAAKEVLGTPQWIMMDYGDAGITPGACALSSYNMHGKYGGTRKDLKAEYQLYQEANERHQSLVAPRPQIASSPPDWYELPHFGLNFGRSQDNKGPLPANVARWRKIIRAQEEIPAQHLQPDAAKEASDTPQRPMMNHGDAVTTPVACANSNYNRYREYQLYLDANKHPQVASSPSGWYELLRFGRNLGRSPDDKDPLPANVAHWRKIKTVEGKEVWADLNAAGTFKFSDADFLPVMGWNCYDDDCSPDDQRCDSDHLKILLRTVGEEPHPDPREDDKLLASRLGDADLRKKLRRVICKFPSEWDKASVLQRYDWVKKQFEASNASPEFWEKFCQHCKAMCFDQLPAAYLKAQWHFHPVEFIKHFRKCKWLSEGEFVQLLPMQVLRVSKTKAGTKAVWETVSTNTTAPSSVLKLHRIPLNLSFRKYGINNHQRMAAFLGNAIQETQWLGKLYEENKSAWYSPWDGRGFLQLTHVENYIRYWRFRGRTINSQVEIQLANATSAANTARKDKNGDIAAKANAHLADKISGVTEEMRLWRDHIQGKTELEEEESKIAPADSAGAYWAWIGMPLYADEKIIIERCLISVSQNTKVYYRSPSFWRASASVNLPKKIDVLWDSQLNGFVDRCVPWAQALAVLGEQYFPRENGMFDLEYPEGNIPRKKK